MLFNGQTIIKTGNCVQPTMGFGSRVKPDEESLLPPPTTIEELWTRMNEKMAKLETGLRKEIREEGDPWLHDTAVYLKQLYANYRKTD